MFGIQWRGCISLVMMVASLSSTAAAQPSIFLQPEAKSAWYIHKATVRPLGSSIDGISKQALNAYRAERWPEFDKICFVDGLDRSSYVALDRETQNELEASLSNLKHDPFRIAFQTADGGSYVARVGVTEECKGSKGAIIVIYDARSKQIADILEWDEDPFRFLWPGRGGSLLAHSSCFECGDWNALYFDVTRKRFYWEYEGD